MPKYEDNLSVMNPNLVYFSLMVYLISSYTSFQTSVWTFNNDCVEIKKNF